PIKPPVEPPILGLFAGPIPVLVHGPVGCGVLGTILGPIHPPIPPRVLVLPAAVGGFALALRGVALPEQGEEAQQAAAANPLAHGSSEWSRPTCAPAQLGMGRSGLWVKSHDRGFGLAHQGFGKD